MRSRAAEVPVIDQKRRSQAQQRLGWQERHLPAAGNRAARPKRPELITGLASSQVQVISQVSHARMLLPARPHIQDLHRVAIPSNRITTPGTAAPSASTADQEQPIRLIHRPSRSRHERQLS
jgi:hypothetical protein